MPNSATNRSVLLGALPFPGLLSAAFQIPVVSALQLESHMSSLAANPPKSRLFEPKVTFHF